MFNFADIARTPEQKALDESMHAAIMQVMIARNQGMEHACEMVMQLGYTPKDCLIEHHIPTSHGIGAAYAERDVLVVRGVPAFEVRVTFDGMQHKISGRVLTWPSPRAPEPAPTSVGGREA